MKRSKAALLVAVLAVFSLLATWSDADEVKMTGVITKIELAADGKSATATLTDNKTSESVVLTITDDLTLDKFKDHRIVEGDEIRVKYENKDGKKMSTYFRKTAGC